jgi:superfamily II DNA or RNA helicase
MKGYDALVFKGIFRDYQQMILDKMDSYLDDKKIHIVAAPGSGKTTLGIELIKRLNQPALILSPSITIRNQWGKRIKDGFLDGEEDIDDYLSFSLKTPKLMTSVTYQGLHAAFHHLIDKDETDEEILESPEIIDYTDFNLLQTIKSKKIRTICLDEAHHLRSEWYKSLVAVLKEFEEEFVIIALTATPPYDSNQSEWEKYSSLCGDIDEEIFVPQLVGQNNLCPHQDYIYFNYPTDEEKKLLMDYRQKAKDVASDLIHHRLLLNWCDLFYHHFLDDSYQLFDNIDDYRTLVHYMEQEDYIAPKKLKRILRGRSRFDLYSMEDIESLFNMIITREDIFSNEISSLFKKNLQENGLIEFGKAQLNTNSDLKRQLVSSIGKITSIGEIAKFESTKMGHDLQMLVLTDFIKKDLVSIIGTSNPIQVIGAVPIFEVIRRNVSKEINVAMLTGSLVIIPKAIEPNLKEEASKLQLNYILTPINDTLYSVITFKGTIKDSVHIVTELFEKRYIDILVGTKSLLGEGWDSPCINTLIMASFVGSYMLSNQMRGRAIRVDRYDADKVASIWHLATVEPYQVVTNNLKTKSKIEEKIESEHIVSHDFDTLKRRFNTFLGPQYSTGNIESGIERIDFIEPPFSKERFQKFNENTFLMASNRELVRNQWQTACPNCNIGEIEDVSEIPTEVWPQGLLIYDAFETLVFVTVMSQVASQIYKASGSMTLLLGLSILIIILIYKPFKRIIFNINPTKSIKGYALSVFNTMKDLSMISSPLSKVLVSKDRYTELINAYLDQATRHEKAVFSSALKEMLSVFDSPRYLVIETRSLFGIKHLYYANAFAVPSLFSSNKTNAEKFANYLSERKGKFTLVYTHSVEGRNKLLKAKQKSNLFRYQITTVGKRVLKDK